VKGIRRHLSFANVVSVIALFIALGGGAYAVQVAQKNSVNSASIRNGSIRSVDIGRGQVRAADLGPPLLRDATSGRSNRSTGFCVQDSTSFTPCFGDQVKLSRPGKIFATADGTADSGSGSVPVGVNTCRLSVDGQPFTLEVVVAADFSPGESFSFSGVTGRLGAGVHQVLLECKGNGTLPGPRIFSPTISAVSLGPG
jgi:hypothetical protein